ncbi:MAG: hypothetical protein ABWZ75_02100 [Novosphingobium sp.]
MSDKLAISAALSVLMMAGFVLFGTEAAHAPIGPGSLTTQVGVTAPLLPSANGLLASVR